MVDGRSTYVQFYWLHLTRFVLQNMKFAATARNIYLLYLIDKNGMSYR